MRKMRVMVTKYGYAVVEAETEKQHYKKSPQWTIPNLTGRIRTMDRLWTMM